MSLLKKNDGKTEHLWVEERLSAYLDDELSAKERTAVEHHLARCQDCQWNLRTLRQTVRLTQELPTVPVPRVFTIPAPAQEPVRARQRSRGRQRGWGLGLLQGATALVALLLVFAVAGDFMLTGLVPGRSAAPIVMKEQEVVDSAATQVAEEEAPRAMKAASAPSAATEPGTTGEAPAAANAEPYATAAPEPTAQPEGSGEPFLQAVPAAPEGTTGPAEKTGPTSEPGASVMGATTLESPLEATQEAAGGGTDTEAPRVAAVPPTTPAQAMDSEPATEAAPVSEAAPDNQVTAATEPVPDAETRQAYSTAKTAEPAEAVPPAGSAEQEPTIVAAAPALAPQAEQERSGAQEQAQATSRDSLVTWVQRAEIALGGALVLLAAATVAVMISRRRAR